MRRETDESVPDEQRDALLTIAHGAVVTSGGLSVKRALLTAAELVLARGLGPLAYGVYALAWRIAQLLVRLVTFGSMPTMQRYVPAYADEPGRRAAIVGLAYATTLGFGTLLAIGIWFGAPLVNRLTVQRPAFPGTLRAFGVQVGLLGVVAIAAGVFRAIESARGEALLNKLLRPAAHFVGATMALALGYAAVGVAGAIVAWTALLAVVAVPVTARVTEIGPTLSGARREAKRFYNHAGPFAMSRLGKVFQNRIDVLLVGALLSAVAAGVYNVILVLITIAWIPLRSFNMLLPPVAADLYARGDVATLDAVYSSVTRLIVTAVVPMLAVLTVYGPTFLGLFGDAYTRGYVPLVLYVGGVFVGSAVGATGWLLMMTDHQYVRMALDWLLAVINVALTYAFTVRFGLAGAALGTSLAIAVQNGIQVLLLRRLEGLWPFDRSFLVPMTAGVAMLLAMWAIRVTLAGHLAVVLGSAAGLLVYVGFLRVIGLDPRDRLVLRELAAEYRTVLSRWLGS